MVQTGHLFAPMPDVIRDDMAFIDRLHFYLPGWEVPKMRNEHFTDHYGFVVDYLAEALRDLRKHNFTEIIDHTSRWARHLNARDRKAVRKPSRADEDPPPAWAGVQGGLEPRSSSWPSRAAAG
jgi:ATP-dependent Lon protease